MPPGTDVLMFKSPRILAADLHRKSVIEAESGPRVSPKRRSYSVLTRLIDFRLITPRVLLENRGQRSAGVFGIDVDASGQHRLLTNVSSGQVEAPFHLQIGVRFDLLRRSVSPKMNDSVKFLEPTTMRSECDGEQDNNKRKPLRKKSSPQTLD